MPEQRTHLSPAVFEQLRTAMEADPGGFRDLYRDYLADARDSLEALKAAIQDRDAVAVRAKAHYLRSSSLVLGAVQVAQEAGNLEDSAVSGSLEHAARRLRDAEHRLNQVTAELVAVLGAEVDPAGKTAA